MLVRTLDTNGVERKTIITTRNHHLGALAVRLGLDPLGKRTTVQTHPRTEYALVIFCPIAKEENGYTTDNSLTEHILV